MDFTQVSDKAVGIVQGNELVLLVAIVGLALTICCNWFFGRSKVKELKASASDMADSIKDKASDIESKDVEIKDLLSRNEILQGKLDVTRDSLIEEVTINDDMRGAVDKLNLAIIAYLNAHPGVEDPDDTEIAEYHD